MKDIDVLNTGDRAVASHTLVICAVARKASLIITPARSTDAFKTLGYLKITSKENYRLALRINLASTREEEVIFDRIFKNYWNQKTDSEGGYILANSEMVKRTLDSGLSNEGHRDMMTETDAFSEVIVARKANLSMRWVH
jgi:uncharacterized protein with von Willebrand factor type A (vWA) domain